MRNIFALTAICLLPACMEGSSTSVSTSSSSSGLPTSVGSVSGPTASESTSFASLLNNVRLDNGAGTISYDARLAAAAQIHSNDQFNMGVMTHTGSDGSSVGDRVSDQGYNFSIVGENVARGYQTEESVMTGWTNSPDHHDNNIDPRFEDFGIAKAGSGSQTYWTLVLAAER